LAERIGCRGYASVDTIDYRLRGSRAVPFVDHFAVECMAITIGDLRGMLHETSDRLATTRGQLAQCQVTILDLRQRLQAADATSRRAIARTDELEGHVCTMARERDAALGEAKNWRARCPVTAADVETAGVTAEQCEAFLLANGGYHCDRFRILSPAKTEGVYAGAREDWMEGSQLFCVAEACNRYARYSNTPAHDVLVAMQRTVVG
jgi:hypothetical protein